MALPHSHLNFLEGLNMEISRSIGEMPSQCGAIETKRIGLISDMFGANLSIFLQKIGMKIHQSYYRLKVGGSETLTTLLHFSLQIFSPSAKKYLDPNNPYQIGKCFITRTSS